MKYQVKGLNRLSKQINDFIKSVGRNNNNVITRLALIHSEVSEALEAFRKGKFANTVQFKQDKARHKPDKFLDKKDYENNIKGSIEEELADIISRTLDLAKYLNIDIEFHLNEKMKYNELRDHNKFGGKNF